MKKNLIRTLVVLLFFSLELGATTYKWSASISKEKAYVNEAVYLRYECRFSDRAELYAVEFNPLRDNIEEEIVILSETSHIEDGKKVLIYEFVAFIHKAKEMELSFDATMKKTNRESIENTVIGRDNGEYAEYKKEKIKLPILKVDVLDTAVPLVGKLSMRIEREAEELESLTPYHLQVILEGETDFAMLKPLEFTIDGVKVFSEVPLKDIELSEDGYRGAWSQKFAFVSEKDFTIPAFKIEYFDLVKKEIKYLEFEGVDIKLIPGYKPEELLDEKNQAELKFTWEYLYYVFAFIAGFFIAKIDFKKAKSEKEQPFCEKVEAIESLKELSVFLVLQKGDKYENIIRSIEKNELTLKKAKQLICV